MTNRTDKNNVMELNGYRIEHHNFDTGELRRLTWTPRERSMSGKLRKLAYECDFRNDEYSFVILSKNKKGREIVWEGGYLQALKKIKDVYK